MIAALQQAREKGYTRYIGYSGDGPAARYAVECGAFDTLQTSVSIADQEAIDLTLPLAREREHGRDRQAADRQRRLAVRRGRPRTPTTSPTGIGCRSSTTSSSEATRRTAAAIALRFTLSLPGVHTAIVGTPEARPMAGERRPARGRAAARREFEAIRSRWSEVADETWVGQI